MAKKRTNYEIDYENGLVYIDGEEHSFEEYDINELFVGNGLNEDAIKKHFIMLTALNKLSESPFIERTWSSGINRTSPASIFNILIKTAVIIDDEGDDIQNFRILANNADDIIISHPSEDVQNEALSGCDIVISFCIYNIWNNNNIDDMRRHSVELLMKNKKK